MIVAIKDYLFDIALFILMPVLIILAIVGYVLTIAGLYMFLFCKTLIDSR